MYTIVGWLILQVIAVVTPALHLPDWVDSFFAVTIIAGFPLSMLMAWAFEMTPEGVKRTETVPEDESIRAETGRKLEYAILIGLLVVGALIIGDRIWPEKSSQIQTAENTPVTEIKTSTQEISEKSIAVLPFSDLSINKDQDYFSDGIAEEILNALAKIDDLRVAGRTSSFVFKDEKRDLIDIGRTLNVAHLLEGSVRKQDDDVRITARLIKGDNLVWSETYNGTLDDIFDLQEDIARAIAKRLEILIDTQSPIRLANTLTNDSASYDLFLRGRNLYRASIMEEDITKALSQLEKAVELDPNFAEAWATLGEAYLSAPAIAGSLDNDIYLAQAKFASERAIEIDPNQSFPYSILASVRTIRSDPSGAMDLHNQALELDPNSPYALSNIGLLQAMMGRSKAAKDYLEQAVERDPASASYKSYLAAALRNTGDLDQSDKLATESAEMGYFIAYDTLAWNAFSRGDSDEAIRLFMLIWSGGGGQLAPDFAAKSQWESAARAYYKADSQSDKEELRALFESYLDSPTANISGVVATVTSRLNMFELFFDNVDDALAANAVALVAIWDDTENSKRLRQHPDFPAFAIRSGMLDFWKEYGWPDRCAPDTTNGASSNTFTCT